MAQLIEDTAYQRMGAHSVQIFFDDKDFQSFLQKLKTLPDKLKRAEMNKIIRRQVEPVLTALKKDTEIRKIKYKGKYGQRPGNLRDSMVISFRKGGRLGVWVGPKTNRFRA